MPAIGSFLANMLLGGLQEGQRRREAQTTVLPHLLNLLAISQYRQEQVGLGKERLELQKEKLESPKLKAIPAPDRKELETIEKQLGESQSGTQNAVQKFFSPPINELHRRRTEILSRLKQSGIYDLSEFPDTFSSPDVVWDTSTVQ